MNESLQLSNNDLFTKLLEAIKVENEKSKREIISHIENENGKLIQTLEKQQQTIDALEQKCEKLEKRNISLERRTRKNNVVIFGLGLNDHNTLALSVVEKLNNLLKINLSERDFNNIYLLKDRSKSTIKVEFLSHMVKNTLFQNIYKLKGTNILILHDMCYEDRVDNKTLVSHLKEARSKNLPAKIRGNKLIVNGEQYTADELRKQEIEEIYENDVPGNEKNRESNSLSAPSTPVTSKENNFEDQDITDEEKVDGCMNQTIKPLQIKLKKPTTTTLGKTDRRTRQNSATSSLN